MNMFYLVLVAVVCGIAMTLQGQFMGVMDKHVGTVESVFITYGGGGFIVGIVLLLMRGGNLSALQTVPWYVLLAGPVGLVIVGSIGYCVPRLGLVAAFPIIVASQFILAAVIDHFGLLGAEVRQMDLSRISGIGIMLLGIWLVIR